MKNAQDGSTNKKLLFGKNKTMHKGNCSDDSDFDINARKYMNHREDKDLKKLQRKKNKKQNRDTTRTPSQQP